MRLLLVVGLVLVLAGCDQVRAATAPTTPIAAQPVNAPELAPLLFTSGYTGDQLATVIHDARCTVNNAWQQIESDPDAYRGQCAIFSAMGRQSTEDPAYFYMALMVGPSLDETVGATRAVVVRWDAGREPGFSFDPTSIHTVIGTVQGAFTVTEGDQNRVMPLVLAADFDLSRVRK